MTTPNNHQAILDINNRQNYLLYKLLNLLTKLSITEEKDRWSVEDNIQNIYHDHLYPEGKK